MGIWRQAWRKPRHFVLLGLVLAMNLIFLMGYQSVDEMALILPPYLVWAIWVVEGYAWLIDWIQNWRGDSRKPSTTWVWGLTVLALVSLLANWPIVQAHTRSQPPSQVQATQASAGPRATIQALSAVVAADISTHSGKGRQAEQDWFGTATPPQLGAGCYLLTIAQQGLDSLVGSCLGIDT